VTVGEPCKQEKAIGSLEATVEAIKETLEKIGESQERFIEVLEKIASQGTEIATLKANQNNLFERVRKVEIKVAEERVKIGGIVAGVSAAVSIATALIVKHLGGK
jgi:uncharacterized coiled-coil protein SlyX